MSGFDEIQWSGELLPREQLASDGNIPMALDYVQDRDIDNYVRDKKSFVEPHKFEGSDCWRVVLHGEDIQIYFSTEEEARQMLWMLKNVRKAEIMVRASSRESADKFSQRFIRLRNRTYGKV